MIVFYIDQTNRKQVYNTVMKAISLRRETHPGTTKMDFCRLSGISRQLLSTYKRSQRPLPTPDTLTKIAKALMAWGHEVRIELPPLS